MKNGDGGTVMVEQRLREGWHVPTRLGMKTLIGLALAAALATPSYAAVHHNLRINCGWPHPDAACTVPAVLHIPPQPTPPARPVRDIPDPTDTNGVVDALVNVRAQLVADLQAVATMAATPNTVAGESWDSPVLWCLNGTPAQGTQGQPGYIPAYPGLIAWLNGLSLPTPAANNSPPGIPAGGGVAAQAEELWLQAQAAKAQLNPVINTIVSGLTNFGPPESVMKPCGALIQDRLQTIQNDVMKAGSQLTLFNGLLLQFLPKAAILAHVRPVH